MDTTKFSRSADQFFIRTGFTAEDLFSGVRDEMVVISKVRERAATKRYLYLLQC